MIVHSEDEPQAARGFSARASVETRTAAPADCPRPWWPAEGKIATRESSQVLRGGTRARYVYQTFTWEQDDLQRMQCDSDVTYEPDAVYNTAGGTFLGNELQWMAATNLPDSYLDTRVDDEPGESIYTIGTGDADALQPWRYYWTMIRTTKGNADIDTGDPRGQIGYHRAGSACPRFLQKYCIFSRPNGSHSFLDDDPNNAFEHVVPGTDYWPPRYK